ncbi:MAG: hypothetical protein ACKO0M_05555, partial [Cyanobium sp.]
MRLPRPLSSALPQPSQPRSRHQGPGGRPTPGRQTGIGWLIAIGFGLIGTVAEPVRAWAASPGASQLQALQSALNGSDPAALRALLSDGPGLDAALLERRWSTLRQRFPDARWQLTPGTPTQKGQPTVNLRVTGTRVEGGVSYRLTADQLLELRSDGNRINAQNLLREQSILRSGESDLPVSVMIPDAVLTG